MNNAVKVRLTSVCASFLLLVLTGCIPTHSWTSIPTHTVPHLNAYDYYIKASDNAAADLNSTGINLPYADPEPAAAYGSLTANQKAIIIRAIAPDLKLLRVGLTLPYVNPPQRDWTAESTHRNVRTIVHLLLLDGEVKADRGDWGGDANSDLDALQMGAAVPHGNTAFGMQIDGDLYEALGARGLRRAIPHLTANEARAVLSRLEKIDTNRASLKDALRETKYEGQASLIAAYKTSDWAKTLADQEVSNVGFDVPEFAFRVRMYGQQRLYNDLTRYYDTAIQISETPLLDKSAPRFPIDTVVQLADNIFDDNVNEYVRRLQIREMDAQAQDAMLITALALREYYVRHSSYPNSLSALVPACLDKIPTDPFDTSRPLGYKRAGSTCVLYSIGPDGVDNSGIPIPKVAGSKFAFPRPESKGDIVYGLVH